LKREWDVEEEAGMVVDPSEKRRFEELDGLSPVGERRMWTVACSFWSRER